MRSRRSPVEERRCDGVVSGDETEDIQACVRQSIWSNENANGDK